MLEDILANKHHSTTTTKYGTKTHDKNGIKYKINSKSRITLDTQKTVALRPPMDMGSLVASTLSASPAGGWWDRDAS